MSYTMTQYDHVSEKQWQRIFLKRPEKKIHFVQMNKDKTYHRFIIKNSATQKTVECILKCWKKEKKSQPRILNLAKKQLKNEGEMMTFSDRQKMRAFPGLSLKNIKVLQAVAKWCLMETWINTKAWRDWEMVNNVGKNKRPFFPLTKKF